MCIPSGLTPFFRGSILHDSISLYCFQNLTASVKQIAEFFGFSPTAEQIQSIADRATFQAVKDKAQETHGVVGSVLFRKGKLVCILTEWWIFKAGSCLGNTDCDSGRCHLISSQGPVPFGKALYNVICRSTLQVPHPSIVVCSKHQIKQRRVLFWLLWVLGVAWHSVCRMPP